MLFDVTIYNGVWSVVGNNLVESYRKRLKVKWHKMHQMFYYL